MSKRAFGRRSSRIAHGREDRNESLQACTLIPLLTSSLTAWQTSRCSRRSAQTTAEGWICDPQENKVFSSRSDRLTFSAHPPSIITERTGSKLMGNNFLYCRKIGLSAPLGLCGGTMSSSANVQGRERVMQVMDGCREPKCRRHRRTDAYGRHHVQCVRLDDPAGNRS